MTDQLTEDEKRLVDGRIVGGYSLHASVDSTKCQGGLRHKGPWRTVDCCGLAGEDRDIIECSECGEQRNVGCNFDEDFS